MKGFINFLGVILTIFMTIWDIVEILALPALLVVIGILNSFSWQYYVISIGGYFLLFAVMELIAHLVFKALDKKYTPIIERKLEKISDRFSKKD